MTDAAPPWAGVGIALPALDTGGHGTPVRDAAVAAEAAGLDHVWVPDHLVFRRPVLEATVALAHVAGATERIGLGFGVLHPGLRPLPWIAKQLATLAVLAPDRLLLGVGTGDEYPPELRSARVDPTRRDALLDEVLELLPALLAGDLVDHAGEQIVECDGLAPVPPRMPPVLVAGSSEADLQRAARHADAHVASWMDPEDVAVAAATIASLARDAGRPAPGTALIAFVNVGDDAAQARTEAAGALERRFARPFADLERWTLTGRVEDVAARLVAYADAGVEGVCLVPAHPRPLEQIEQVARVRDLLVDAGS